jgi:hypothetical protein
MVATFRKVFPDSGMDEARRHIHAGIIVPLGGSNLVALQDGAGLKVRSRFDPAIQVTELDAMSVLAARDMVYGLSFSAPNLALFRTQIMQSVQSTRLRVFKITGNSLAGLNGTVEAVDPKTSTAQATLACYVVDKRPVTVAYRPVQVRDERGTLVPFWNGAFDAKATLAGMNSIWTPQANVVLSLGRTDPVEVAGLTPKTERAVIQSLTDELVKKKDPNAEFTMFLVKNPYDSKDAVSGVCDPKAGFCLIDGKTARTAAHEFGHFLGSLSEKRKYSQTYGEKDPGDPDNKDTLMLSGGGGARIPYNDVPAHFNYGYRK